MSFVVESSVGHTIIERSFSTVLAKLHVTKS